MLKYKNALQSILNQIIKIVLLLHINQQVYNLINKYICPIYTLLQSYREMVKQIFRTDRKFWTQSQSDEIQVFFQFNSFFSKFYEHKDFDKIVAMTYYSKIHKNSSIMLENSKRPQAVILLSGKVNISRKFYKQKAKKPKQKKSLTLSPNQSQPTEYYQTLITLTQQSQSFVVQSECKVTAINQMDAQILFIPSILYNQHIKCLELQKSQILFKGLRSFFPKTQRKILLSLTNSGCFYKQFRMNDFIYRAGSMPEQVYLLMEGNVKLQKPGFSAKKMFEMSILNPLSMFGQKDIKLNARQKNAIACSAYARTLIIPKKNFLRFAKQNLPDLIFLTQQESQNILPVLKRNTNSLYVFEQKQSRKPKFKRFHSSSKIENQKFIETKLIKNCHILVNLSPKKSKTSRLQGKTDMLKDYSKDQFKEKMKLFRKIRPNAKLMDFQNPIIDLTPRRSQSFRSQQQRQ